MSILFLQKIVQNLYFYFDKGRAASHPPQKKSQTNKFRVAYHVCYLLGWNLLGNIFYYKQLC